MQLFRFLNRAAVCAAFCLGGLGTVLTSCSTSVAEQPLMVVDLNRTTAEPMALSTVVADSSALCIVNPTALGTYVVCTDTLPTGIYQAVWDDGRTLPLFIRRGQPLRVCGTWQQWHAMSASSAETTLLWQAQRIAQRLRVGRDTLLAHLDVADAAQRTQLADSINALRQICRGEADRLLAGADTSMAALAIVGMADLYDPVADFDIVRRLVANVAERHPASADVALLQDDVARLSHVAALKQRYARGAHAPQFAFLRSQSDTLSESSFAFYHKTYALVVAEDSAQVAGQLRGIVADVLASGGRVVAQAPDNADLPASPSLFRGSFASADELRHLWAVGSAAVVVGADGTVQRLFIGRQE